MGRRGFTLYELIMVLGTIALLIVVLIPALRDVHEQALSAACKTNLHQLAALCQNYTLTHGHYPWGMIEPSTHEETYWSGELVQKQFPAENPVLHGVRRWTEFSSFCWDFTKKASDGAGWSCGEMFAGRDAASVMCCPKCRAAATDNWDGNRMTGYNYNVCYLGYIENDSGKRLYPTARAAVTHPDRVVVFGDGGYAGGPNKFMRAPFQDKNYDMSASSLRKAGTQAFRHGFGAKRHCNMAFADGHVESFTKPFKAGGSPGWVDEASHSAFIGSGNGIYGPRGFGETDDQEPYL